VSVPVVLQPVSVADVRFDIEHHTNAYTGRGALTTQEVDRLVRLAADTDAYGTIPDLYLPWQASTVYTLNTVRVPSTRTGHTYKVTTAGTSGTTEPTAWPTTAGATVTDGTVVWTVDIAAPWIGSWNVNEASAVGCEWRATKLADQFTVALGNGKSFNRMETPQFWLARAKELRRAGGFSVMNVSSAYARL
jgi:hypothetical protein